MLNAMSSFETDKSQTVLKSIEFAFSSSAVTHSAAPSMEDEPEQDEEEGDALDHLQRLFETEISGIEATKNRLGTELHIRLPLAALEKAVKNSPLQAPAQPEPQEGQELGAVMAPPIGGFFLPTLVSLMESDEAGVSYRMDMVMNMNGNPAALHNDGAASMDAAKRTMSGIAEAIETAGLPKKLISPGIAQGRRGFADLYFRRYVPYNPLGDQEDRR